MHTTSTLFPFCDYRMGRKYARFSNTCLQNHLMAYMSTISYQGHIQHSAPRNHFIEIGIEIATSSTLRLEIASSYTCRPGPHVSGSATGPCCGKQWPPRAHSAALELPFCGKSIIFRMVLRVCVRAVSGCIMYDAAEDKDINSAASLAGAGGSSK